MAQLQKRSRLSIDLPIKEHLQLKVWAATQNRSISDFVLSCVREHMACSLEHIPNAKTTKNLDESEI